MIIQLLYKVSKHSCYDPCFLIDFAINVEELERPNSDIGCYHVLSVDIVGTNEENYPTHEEHNLFDDKYLFKPLDELLYVAVGNRVYYFCLSDGEIVYKKLIADDKQ
jgi:hypothetical protein